MTSLSVTHLILNSKNFEMTLISINKYFLYTINPIQDGHFRGWDGGTKRIEGVAKGPPLLNICRTCPTMMKRGTLIPYLKKIQKICQSSDATPEFC